MVSGFSRTRTNVGAGLQARPFFVYAPRMFRWALSLLALPLLAQAPAFDVASIHPSKGEARGGSFCRTLKPGVETYAVAGVTLNLLIIDAYDADRFDLPDWGRDRFDVSVKVPAGTTTDACKAMLRSLLAERFHLVVSVESRMMPVYFLKVAPGGLKLKAVAGPPADIVKSLRLAPAIAPGRTHWTYQAAPMSRVFTSVEAGVATGANAGDLDADRVVDDTGLTGYYDGELDYQHPSLVKPDGTNPGVPHAPSLKDALESQLGLTLELRKAPRTILTIVSADRTPTEN